MEALAEIKHKIFKTECKELLYDGLSRSEPIMTMGDKGIIDNYFIYAGNNGLTKVSSPMAAFGIYSDIEETAYINLEIYDEKSPSKENRIDRKIVNDQYIREYEELYRGLRGFVFKKCNGLQKDILSKYMEHLYCLSGTGLWQNYLEIAPVFFEWANGEGVRTVFE